MTNEADVRRKTGERRNEDLPAGGNLALWYDSILTSVVRLQSSRQSVPDIETFRKRIKSTLQEIEQVAISAGYDGHDIRDTHFAVVALLDSAALRSRDPVLKDWDRHLLHADLFDKSDAGVVFFDKLDQLQLRRDSEQLANILEVYLFCLLLGFEGRYSGGMRGGLDSIVERLKGRIENIRGRRRPISPEGALAGDQATEEFVENRGRDSLRLIAFAAIAFTILSFLFFKINLYWTAEQLRSRLP
jgi:type VI secretion system protein ImpK